MFTSKQFSYFLPLLVHILALLQCVGEWNSVAPLIGMCMMSTTFTFVYAHTEAHARQT